MILCTRETSASSPWNNSSETSVYPRIYSLGELIKNYALLGLTTEIFDSESLVWGLVICLFSKCADGSDTVDPGTTL